MGDTPIDVAYPAAEALHLRMAIGACWFGARPGGGDAWVAGTYDDPNDRRPTRIVEEGASVTITEEEPSFERIPAVIGSAPRYELMLGRRDPSRYAAGFVLFGVAIWRSGGLRSGAAVRWACTPR